MLNLLINFSQEVLPISRKLGERVLESCATKLKPYLAQAVKTLEMSLDDYSKVVASICKDASDDAEQNEVHASDEHVVISFSCFKFKIFNWFYFLLLAASLLHSAVDPAFFPSASFHHIVYIRFIFLLSKLPSCSTATSLPIAMFSLNLVPYQGIENFHACIYFLFIALA